VLESQDQVGVVDANLDGPARGTIGAEVRLMRHASSVPASR